MLTDAPGGGGCAGAGAGGAGGGGCAGAGGAGGGGGGADAVFTFASSINWLKSFSVLFNLLELSVKWSRTIAFITILLI